jgi:hypothetical protein
LAPTRVEASDARHNAEIVGPHNEAALRPDLLSPREKNPKFEPPLFLPPMCSRCRGEARQLGQRWCRQCRTVYERERRQRDRHAERTGAPRAAPIEFGWGFEVCGERFASFRALGQRYAPGCGQRFPAWHQGQIYCCNGHGRGAVMHSADCPLIAKAPLPQSARGG